MKIKEVRKSGKIIHETFKAVLFLFENDKKAIWLPRTSFSFVIKKTDEIKIKLSLRYYNSLHDNQQPSL